MFNVTLLAFAAERRCCWMAAAVDRYLLLARRSAENLLRLTDGTDGRTINRFIYPAPQTAFHVSSVATQYIRFSVILCFVIFRFQR